MAQKKQGESEDQEITHVTIKKAQIVGDQTGPVVLYQVDLRNDYREWTVLKRFKAFKQLEEDVKFFLFWPQNLNFQ
jgi:hypothetical protein